MDPVVARGIERSVHTQAVLLPADTSLSALLRLAHRHGLRLRRGEDNRGVRYWEGATEGREWSVLLARHSTGYSVSVTTASGGQLRLSHATPRAVWTGLAALLGDDYSWRL